MSMLDNFAVRAVVANVQKSLSASKTSGGGKAFSLFALVEKGAGCCKLRMDGLHCAATSSPSSGPSHDWWEEDVTRRMAWLDSVHVVRLFRSAGRFWVLTCRLGMLMVGSCGHQCPKPSNTEGLGA